MPKPICLWSGPRNVSTALMYSFAQHPAVSVIDEPLYGHYLRASGATHPGREEVMARMNCDGNAVVRDFLGAARAAAPQRLFIKHMAHHLVDLDLGFLDQTCNLLLIRDPREMLPSLTVQLPAATLADTGLDRQWQLLSELRDRGQDPVVLDSRELLLNPPAVLAELCRRIGLSFTERMLHWQAGGLAEDGIWAKHWYHAVHESTGFAAYQEKHGFPDALLPLLEESRPCYDKLYAEAIRAPQQESTH